MDLRKQVLNADSKVEARAIVDSIGTNQAHFDALMQLFLYDEWRLGQRASWIVGMCAEAHPSLIMPHIEAMITKLRAPHHDAVRRNIVRTFQFIDLPEEWLGEVVDLCFQYLANPQEPIAVRVFSMTVLYQASLREPDLQYELCLIIEQHLPESSAGFRSRGRKILAQLKKRK